MCTNDGSGTWAAFGGTYLWSEDFSQLEYVGQIPNSTLGSWGWGEESAGGHDPYHVPFQGNHDISCACKIGTCWFGDLDHLLWDGESKLQNGQSGWRALDPFTS